MPLLMRSNPIRRVTLDTTSQERGESERVRMGRKAYQMSRYLASSPNTREQHILNKRMRTDR